MHFFALIVALVATVKIITNLLLSQRRNAYQVAVSIEYGNTDKIIYLASERSIGSYKIK